MMNYHNPLGNPLTFAVNLCTQSHLSELDLLLFHWRRGTPKIPNPHQTFSFPGSHSCDPHYSIIIIGHTTRSGYWSAWIRSLLFASFSPAESSSVAFSITDSLESGQCKSGQRSFLLRLLPAVGWMSAVSAMMY